MHIYNLCSYSYQIAHVGSCQGSLRFGISTFHNFLIWRIKYLGWVVRININNQNWNVRILDNCPSCGDDIPSFDNIVSNYHNGSRLLQVSTYSNLPPRGPLHPIKYLIVWLYLQPMASGWDEITALYNFPNPHRGSKAWLDEGWIATMVAIAGLDRSRSALAKLYNLKLTFCYDKCASELQVLYFSFS